MALAKKIKRLARLLLPTRTLELAAEMRPKKKPISVNFQTRAAAQLAQVFKTTGASFQTRAPQPTSASFGTGASFQTRAPQSLFSSTS